MYEFCLFGVSYQDFQREQLIQGRVQSFFCGYASLLVPFFEPKDFQIVHRFWPTKYLKLPHWCEGPFLVNLKEFFWTPCTCFEKNCINFFIWSICVWNRSHTSSQSKICLLSRHGIPNPVYSVPCESGEVRRFSWNITVESLVLMSEELIMCTILLLVVGCIWKSAFWESRREIVFVEIYFVSVLLLCSAIEWKRYRNVVLWYMKLYQYFAQYICLLLWGCSRSEEKVRKKSRVCSVTCTVPKCAVVLSNQVKE